ncbi:hypothetical protein RclHR1_20450002 [Rhizophagus clarus]|nr:hypothetical protein RclHR1_20450002 [Rhizophagus clarus]
MKSMILVFQFDYVSLTETRKQLSMAIETIASDFIGSENSALHYGIHLANYMNEYSLTGKDLPMVSVSNGVVECVFSHQNLIKTKLCNKMSIQTLNLHLHLSLNGPKDFSNYNYEKAYDY